MLLDVTPDQEMLDEGVAREVINRIQKLRKKVSTLEIDHNFFIPFFLAYIPISSTLFVLNFTLTLKC